MSFPALSVGAITASALLLLLLPFLKRKYYRIPYPPGPPGNILFGNLSQIPSSQPWRQFRDWSKVYGKSDPFAHSV